jgi:uncharacterized protein YsxB (DUF464 family)
MTVGHEYSPQTRCFKVEARYTSRQSQSIEATDIVCQSVRRLLLSRVKDIIQSSGVDAESKEGRAFLVLTLFKLANQTLEETGRSSEYALERSQLKKIIRNKQCVAELLDLWTAEVVKQTTEPHTGSREKHDYSEDDWTADMMADLMRKWETGRSSSLEQTATESEGHKEPRRATQNTLVRKEDEYSFLSDNSCVSESKAAHETTV